jgi:hypothetical protein
VIRRTLLALTLAVVGGSALAAVPPEEASRLGKDLTPVGAEKAGNADGTIPEWSGGLTQIPAGFVQGSGLRPDPYAGEKPRLVINGQNAEQYRDKLSAIVYALLKRYPDYRLDVYPTHRSVTYPQKILDNVFKNATQARSTEGGLSFEGALPGYPFPIPKTGNEAMWNHLLRYQSDAAICKFDAFNIDSAGVSTLSATGTSYQEFPLYNPARLDRLVQSTDEYNKIKISYTGPARRAGESLLAIDHVNPLAQPRMAWQYLPGQRRVRRAPDIAYDTPNPGVAGAGTYDDGFMFNGAMDRYDFKLVGKKEMFVPYNAYTAVSGGGKGTKPADIIGPHFQKPDSMRWELHRVWVVEATLKPGERHIYARRVFYLDEDSWVGLLSDQYDTRGNLYRGLIIPTAFAYDVKALGISMQSEYDLIAGMWVIQGMCGDYYGTKFPGPFPASDWKPDALAGAGIR